MSECPPIVIVMFGFNKNGPQTSFSKWLKEMIDWNRVSYHNIVGTSPFEEPESWICSLDSPQGNDKIVMIIGPEYDIFPSISTRGKLMEWENWLERGKKEFPKITIIFSYVRGFYLHKGQMFESSPAPPVQGHTC